MKNINKLPIKKQEKIAERLKTLRTTAGYTQEEIAKKINVTTKTYREWEKGKYAKDGTSYYPAIECDNLLSLSEIYKVSTDYLLCHSNCTSVSNHYISKETGLSDEAINQLNHLSSFPSGKNSVQIISYFIEHGYDMIMSIRKIYEYKINYDKCKHTWKSERPPLTNESIYEDETITNKRNLIDKKYKDAQELYEAAPVRAIGKFDNLIKKMIDDFSINGWK